MTIFVESQWIWIALGIFVFVSGFILFTGNRENKTLLFTLIATALVIGGGLLFEHLVVTDNEVIRGTFKKIAADIKSDDIEKVKSHIAKDSHLLQDVAVNGMNQVKLDVVNFSNFEIMINDTTSPVTANIKFYATFRGKLKGHSLLGGQSVGGQYKFEAVFEKVAKDKWLATDEVVFDGQFPLKYDYYKEHQGHLH